MSLDGEISVFLLFLIFLAICENDRLTSLLEYPGNPVTRRVILEFRLIASEAFENTDGWIRANIGKDAYESIIFEKGYRHKNDSLQIRTKL